MMIHADEASKISQANRDVDAKVVGDLGTLIRMAAKEGKSRLEICNVYGAKTDSLIKILRENGYGVARQKSHQLNPEELIITW